MMPRLLLEPEAEAELLEAARWYAGRSPALAVAFRDSVGATLGAVEEAPERFPIAARHPQRGFAVFHTSSTMSFSLMSSP